MTQQFKRYAILFSSLLAVFLATIPSSAQVPDELSTNPRDGQVAELIANDVIEVIVPTIDSTLVWTDVAASLAQSLTLDAPTLERMLPTGSLDLRSPTTLLVLFGIDMAMGDAVAIRMVNDAAGQPSLSFRCDRRLMQNMAPQKRPAKPAGISIDDDWKTRTADKPLMMFFHGLKSHPSKFDDLRIFMREAGFATAAVSYDDHQSIRDSAAQINQIAGELFTPPSQPKLVLVGHSMGGLVAREWTENPKLRSNQIAALITVGTPHRGSNWASLPPLLDLFAEGSVDSSDLVDVLLHKPSAPGMRELAPESQFLTEMAARPRQPNVQYTTIIGTGSPVTEVEVSKLRSTLQRLDQEGSMLRLIRPRIQPLLQSFDELARGRGDGIVAVDRASIRGVDDVVKVERSHIDLISPPKACTQQPVWQAILKRVKR